MCRRTCTKQKIPLFVSLLNKSPLWLWFVYVLSTLTTFILYLLFGFQFPTRFQIFPSFFRSFVNPFGLPSLSDFFTSWFFSFFVIRDNRFDIQKVDIFTSVSCLSILFKACISEHTVCTRWTVFVSRVCLFLSNSNHIHDILYFHQKRPSVRYEQTINKQYKYAHICGTVVALTIRAIFLQTDRLLKHVEFLKKKSWHKICRAEGVGLSLAKYCFLKNAIFLSLSNFWQFHEKKYILSIIS